MTKSRASEALRVTQQVAAIRAALKKRGYSICKRPKQAAWAITPLPKITPPLARGTGRVSKEPGERYLLTYQPAPISAWVLHPQHNAPDYHTLETLIQQAITRSAL